MHAIQVLLLFDDNKIRKQQKEKSLTIEHRYLSYRHFLKVGPDAMDPWHVRNNCDFRLLGIKTFEPNLEPKLKPS